MNLYYKAYFDDCKVENSSYHGVKSGEMVNLCLTLIHKLNSCIYLQ